MNAEITRDVIAALTNADAMPVLMFNSKLNIGEAIAKATATSTTTDTESDIDRNLRWFSEANSAGLISSEIDGYADALVDSLHRSIADAAVELRNVTIATADICTKIELDVTNALAIDPKLAKLIIDEEADHTFERIDFSIVDSVATAKTLFEVCEDDVSTTNLNPHLRARRVLDVRLSMDATAHTVVDIEITPEDRTAIISAVNAKSELYEKDGIGELLTLLTSTKFIGRFGVRCKNITSLTGPTCESMIEAIKLVGKTYPMLRDLASAISDAGYTQIDTAYNERRLLVIIEQYAYFVQYLRQNTLHDVLVFPNRLVNPDLTEELAIARINDLHIARYISQVFGDTELPKVGIGIKQVITQSERIVEAFDKATLANRVQIEAKRNRLYANAFVKHVGLYLNSIDIKSNEYTEMRSSELRRLKVPLENLVYDVLIVRSCKNRATKLLHTEFGIEYSKLVSENAGVISDTFIVDATLEAYASVMLELLKPLLVK